MSEWYPLGVRARMYAATVAILIATILAGALMPAPEDLLLESYRRYEELLRSLRLKEAPLDVAVYRVFFHNLYVAALMFVPLLGLVVAIYSAFTTGLVLHAVAFIESRELGLALLSLVLSPSTWGECLAYSIAITESVFLGRALLLRRRVDLSLSLALFTLALSILLLSATIELALVRAAP